MRTAVFAGTFDPITLGHVDVVRRGLALFDEVVVSIGHNPAKSRTLSLETRVQLVEAACASLGNVRVDTYEGLTVEHARKLGAAAILRGLRDATDLGFEAPIAHANRGMAPAIETVFVLTDPALAFVSSSLMREIVAAGGDASRWLPPASWARASRGAAPVKDERSLWERVIDRELLLSAFSHDVRGPVTALSGYAELEGCRSAPR